MDSVDSQKAGTFVYPRHTIERAILALICSPFKVHLFMVMYNQSIPSSALIGENGYQQGYTQGNLSDLTCQNNLSWLIDVGLLRREVDGQGITDSYRLTPLGRQAIAEFADKELPQPSWSDRLKNAFTRWLRLPF